MEDGRHVLRIALIDDSEVALEWVRGTLEPFGVEVVTYGRSLGIQAFVRRAKPDLVLLDVNMPALNGDIACRMLKENAATRDVRVALYSSMEDDALGSVASACGADGHVTKTEDVSAFVAQIERVLGRRLKAP